MLSWKFIKVGDTMGFLCDQGTEKAEESGEHEAQEGVMVRRPCWIPGEKDVSVRFSHCSFTGSVLFNNHLLSSDQMQNLSGHTVVSSKVMN